MGNLFNGKILWLSLMALGGPVMAVDSVKNVLFRTGFQGTDQVVPGEADAKTELFGGEDSTLPSPNSWSEFQDDPRIGTVKMEYEDGFDYERLARVVRSTYDPSNRFLKFRLTSPNVRADNGVPSKGRVQMSIYNNRDIREFSYSVRTYFDPGFEQLRKYPSKIDWMTVAEFWNNLAGKEYPFRISVNLVKPFKAADCPYYFEVHAQTYIVNENGDKEWQTFWSQQSLTPVPVAEWIKLDYRLKEGDRTHGRFTLNMTTRDGGTQTVLNVSDITYHPSDPNPDGFGHINPMKLYTSAATVNYMKARGLPLVILWDDFEFAVWD